MRRPDEWVSRDVAERSKPVLAILQVSCVSAGFIVWGWSIYLAKALKQSIRAAAHQLP